MNNTIEVGTAGFVRLVSHYGSDLLVVNCARVSYAKEVTALTEKDHGLITYLAKHGHWTPFGHPQVTLHVKAPISVARQWMRSNVGIVYNEVSRRYVDSPPEFAYPLQTRVRPAPGDSKQGSSGDAIPSIDCWFKDTLQSHSQVAFALYEKAIAAGIAPEQARDLLPLNTYTEFWMTASLAALARIYHLRADIHAQAEIREYAEAIDHCMIQFTGDSFAHSWLALLQYGT